MTNDRMLWWGKDLAWWRRERIVTLGETYGADGPAFMDWLSCEAKMQNVRSYAGIVKFGVRSASRGCFVSPERVEQILSTAQEIGLLENIHRNGDGIIEARISGWGRDQRRIRDNLRKAASRAS